MTANKAKIVVFGHIDEQNRTLLHLLSRQGAGLELNDLVDTLHIQSCKKKPI